MKNTTHVRGSGPGESLRLPAVRSHPRVLELARAWQVAAEAVASERSLDQPAIPTITEI